jgi:hypothetical protein
MTRDEVVKAARSWLRTPFVPQAAGKHHGCDCAGLVIGLAKEFGSAQDDAGPYSKIQTGR